MARQRELEKVTQVLEVDNTRMNAMIKSLTLELQVALDRAEGTRIRDEALLAEQDVELGRLRHAEVEYTTRIEVLSAQVGKLELDNSAELARLRGVAAMQRDDLEALTAKVQALEHAKTLDANRTNTLIVEHEQELGLWRARYLQLEAENGRLRAQVQILLSEAGLTNVDERSTHEEALLAEVETLKRQFDLLS